MKDILRKLRERSGLSVPEAAEKLRVTRATVYAWEAGGKLPDPLNLRAAMELYGATPDECDKVAHLRAFGPDDAPATVAA